MYYINYHKTNHNVETCRVKKKNSILVVYEVTTQQIKVQKPMRYYGNICGGIGHKLIDCPKYNDMHNMFKNKRVKNTKKQGVVEPKVANPLVHIMDVNMAITRARLLNNRCPRIESQSRKIDAKQKKEQRLQQSFMKILQEMQAKDPLINLIQTEKTQWSTSWARVLEFEVCT